MKCVYKNYFERLPPPKPKKYTKMLKVVLIKCLDIKFGMNSLEKKCFWQRLYRLSNKSSYFRIIKSLKLQISQGNCDYIYKRFFW